MFFEMYYSNLRIFILFCELIFIIILIPASISYFNKIFKKEVHKNELINTISKHRLLTAIYCLVIMVSIFDFICKIALTEQKIGSFYEEKNYEKEFYVLVSKKSFDENTGIYKIPACIHSVRGGMENNSYYIKSMFFKNQTIYFSEPQEIFLNSDWKIKDDENNVYYIQLTKESVY